MTLTHENIMVIDDDPDIREALAAFLKTEGYDVEEAPNGQEALRELHHMHDQGKVPDLILLDLSMPVMSGPEFRGEQRLDPDLAAIPIVICSAEVDGARQAKDLGVAAFLQKPVGAETLLSTVERHIKAHTH